MGKDKREIRINGVFNTTINGEHHETIEIKELEGCITIGFRTRDDGVELDCGVVGDINSMDAAVAALEVFRKLPNGVKNLTMLTLADALGLGEKPDGGGAAKNSLEIGIDLKGLLKQLFDQ